MISVCLASYNGEKYIAEQINSILVQLDEKDELIISDDGSTDATIHIIKGIDDVRIKLIHHVGQHGYTHNFENALKHATGNYIFFSDQDDVWLPNKIEKMMKWLVQDNYVISDAYVTNEKLNIKYRLSEWRRYRKGYFPNLSKSIYAGCTAAFTRNIRNYALPFPKSKLIQHDTWIGLLCELKFNVVYIDEPLIYFRRHKANTSSSGNKSSNNIFFMLKYRLALLFFTLKRYISEK